MKTIEQHTFKNLNSLESLNLSSNDFLTFDSTSFSSLSNLKVLNLAYCDLKILEPCSFSQLKMLESVFVHKNQLESFDSIWFHGSNSFKFQTFSSNEWFQWFQLNFELNSK